jgi:hypothetical protein
MSRIVAGDSITISMCDVAPLRSHMLHFPMQAISSASKSDNCIGHHRVESGQTADLAKVDLL